MSVSPTNSVDVRASASARVRLQRVLLERESILAIFLMLFVLAISLWRSRYFSSDNLLSILNDASVFVIIATGLTMVVISGGIDISIGSELAAAATVYGTMLHDGMPATAAIFAALATGLLLGAVNGALVVGLSLSPIIVTLATLFIYRGLLVDLTNAHSINIFGTPGWFNTIGSGRVGRVPVPVLIGLGVLAAGVVVMSQTQVGRRLYAIGGNEQAAVLAGLNPRRLKFFVYAACGLLAGVGGIVFVSKFKSVDAGTGSGYELIALAAVVLGGSDVFGGEGRPIGTAIGAVLIFAIYNAMVVAQIAAQWQNAVVGGVIVLAVAADSARRAWSMRRGG